MENLLSSKYCKIISLVAIEIFLIVFIKSFIVGKSMKIQLTCNEIYRNTSTCLFNCTIYSYIPEKISGRILITHSGWASIYDEVFNFSYSKSLLIDLPRRNYTYKIYGGAYNDEYFAGIEKSIKC